MTPVKICGLSTRESVHAALDGGAAFVGFMFFDRSPRNIAPEAAERLAEAARGRAKVVAVTVDPSDALLERLAASLRPDFIQLHGRESPNRVREIVQRSGAAVIKTLPVSTADDFAHAADYEEVAEHLMFDTKPPEDAAAPGGRGEAFDWDLLARRRFARPWFLAGGLDPWNVADALARSRAPMVDVSSGVERGPGLKDPALIEAFLEAVRRA
ncbi:MAG: phosphoribosylanthranilate isomerase [Caulobacterales bacterium]